VIPPKENAAFVASMEDVIEVYHRPHDAARPLVCLDETSKQLVAETRTPVPETAHSVACGKDPSASAGSSDQASAKLAISGMNSCRFICFI